MPVMEYAIALDFAMMVVLLLIASAQHRKDAFDTGMNAHVTRQCRRGKYRDMLLVSLRLEANIAIYRGHLLTEIPGKFH